MSEQKYSQKAQQLKQQVEEQKDMLKASKKTIGAMVDKEKNLVTDIEKRVTELRDFNEAQRKNNLATQHQRDQLKTQNEKLRSHNDQLKTMLQFKEDQLRQNFDENESERGLMEKLQKENKDLQNKYSKAEFDAKKLVRIVKQYSEKNEKLQSELNKLHIENDQLIGHKNPS
jgi:hypothetical protein